MITFHPYLSYIAVLLRLCPNVCFHDITDATNSNSAKFAAKFPCMYWVMI